METLERAKRGRARREGLHGMESEQITTPGTRRFSKQEKWLLFLFLLSLPLVNPWVRGDGVGYYAYIRSALIDHDIRFENDWLAGNPSFLASRVDASGHLLPNQYTPTGHVGNHFAVGPSMLWAPVMVAVHVAVLGLDRLGAHIAADGSFAAVPHRDGNHDGGVRFPGPVVIVSDGSQVYGRAVGADGDIWNLVGQLAARLHVFQSLLVSRALGVRRGSLSCGIGTRRVSSARSRSGCCWG